MNPSQLVKYGDVFCFFNFFLSILIQSNVCVKILACKIAVLVLFSFTQKKTGKKVLFLLSLIFVVFLSMHLN